MLNTASTRPVEFMGVKKVELFRWLGAIRRQRETQEACFRHGCHHWPTSKVTTAGKEQHVA